MIPVHRAGALALALAFVSVPTSAGGATRPSQNAARSARTQEWGSARAQALIARAIERRAEWTGRSEGLEDYQARARGHIYFLFDLGRQSERHLVKADQLALNLFWRAPDQTRQVIVGRREKEILPTRIEYHLDHLTVVMDNFDDRIRLGEGSEVRDVLHPAAPGALEFYQYRLTDSLTLVLPDRRVRVYRVQTRPRDPRSAGIVGSLFLDRETADIVRMEFTFTASAYLDRQLDYINVRLENALWDGRYWLPYRQGLELRRELKVLDFPAGGIIRAEFRIDRYRFNTGFPPDLVRGPPVTYLPSRVRARFDFDEGLFDALDPSVATAPPSMEEVRESASRIVRESYLRRMESLRLAVPGISSVFRFRRGEGLYTGPGISRDFPGGVSLTLMGGRAWGADRWQVQGWIGMPLSRSYQMRISAYHDRAEDATPWPASAGAISTLAALVDGEDYREPFWASGGQIAIRRAAGPIQLELAGSYADWEPAVLAAEDVVDRRYRAVRALDSGSAGAISFSASRLAPGALQAVGGASWDIRLEGAARSAVGDFDYVRALARASRFWPVERLEGGLRLSAEIGALTGGRPPAQRLLPVGGRGTVRGYPFHRFVGDLYGVLGAELNHQIAYPFVSVSAFVDIGWVGTEGGDGVRRALAVWNQTGERAGASRGALVGVGAGVGLLFDVLNVELARGLDDDGIWELVVRASPRFWGWL